MNKLLKIINFFRTYNNDTITIKKSFSKDSEIKIYSEVEILEKHEVYQNILSNLSKGSVLDIGCGSGRFPLFLSKKGYKVSAIDFNEDMIKYAKSINTKKKINFIVYDIKNKLPFKNNYFDNVISIYNVLTYLPKKEDRLFAIKEMIRVLKKNGKIILTFSNRNYPKVMFKSIISYVLAKLIQNKNFSFGDIFVTYKDENVYNVFKQHIFSAKELNNIFKMFNLRFNIFVESHFKDKKDLFNKGIILIGEKK